MLKNILVSVLLLMSFNAHALTLNFDKATGTMVVAGKCIAIPLVRSLLETFPDGQTEIEGFSVQIVRKCTLEERALAALAPIEPKCKVNNNGSLTGDRPAKKVVHGNLVVVRGERAVIGEECVATSEGHVKAIYNSTLEHRRLKRDPLLISVCECLR